MARIRTIKPEFWTSEKVVECSAFARLLFIGLWNFADDAGRIEDSAKQMKMKVFPGDDLSVDTIHGLLSELSMNELVTRYEVDNKGYIQVKGWHHQKINRPNPSKLPPPPVTTHGALTEQTPPEGKGREGKGKDNNPLTPFETGGALKEDFNCLLERCFEAAELDPTKILNPRIHTGSTAAVEAWVKAGANFENHIHPTIRETLSIGRVSDPTFRPKTLKYYEKAVLDCVAKAKPEGEWEDTETPQWRVRVQVWQKTSKWRKDLLGPQPDEIGTRVPVKVLAEYQIAQQQAG